MTLEAFEERMHKLTSRNLSAEAEVIFQQASGDNTDDPRRKVSERALYPEIFDQLWANLIGRSFITSVLGFVTTRHAGRRIGLPDLYRLLKMLSRVSISDVWGQVGE